MRVQSMLRTTVALLVLTLQLVQAPAGSRKPAAGSSFANIVDGIVRDAMQDGRTPGVSVAVARGGKIIYAKGYGLASVELSVPATPDTVYRIGSITKQFTAAAVMQLV